MNNSKLSTLIKGIFILQLVALLNFSCNKIAGLSLQTNDDHVTSTRDAHIYKNVWQFIKDKSIGSDTILNLMYQGILYSGIDTNLYIQDSNRTYILYHNDGVLKLATSGKPSTSCYFGYYKRNSKDVVTSWNYFPPAMVKNTLLYLIVNGKHTFQTLNVFPEFDTTLMPQNYDVNNPQSLVTFLVSNDRYSYLWINDFPGSIYPAVVTKTNPGLAARTAGILATNGSIHVIDKVLYFKRSY